MLVYQIGIQIYDQISILINWSEVKLRRFFSIELGLKRVQIARNITKVGVHVYQMGIQIYDRTSIHRIWSKVKLCHVVSLGLGLKGVKIA